MKYYKELPNGYKEVYSIDAGNKKNRSYFEFDWSTNYDSYVYYSDD